MKPQPIETAPKDGSEFLAWSPTSRGGVWGFCVWLECIQCWQDPDAPVGGEMAPTHWLPLPPAPEA